MKEGRDADIPHRMDHRARTARADGSALRHANRSDITEGERAQRLAVVDSMAGELFTPPPRRAGGLSAHQLRALELVWEDGLDFQGDGSMLDSIAEALDGKRRA